MFAISHLALGCALLLSPQLPPKEVTGLGFGMGLPETEFKGYVISIMHDKPGRLRLRCDSEDGKHSWSLLSDSSEPKEVFEAYIDFDYIDEAEYDCYVLSMTSKEKQKINLAIWGVHPWDYPLECSFFGNEVMGLRSPQE